MTGNLNFNTQRFSSNIRPASVITKIQDVLPHEIINYTNDSSSLKTTLPKTQRHAQQQQQNIH